MIISGTSNNFTSVIMACMVIQAVVKANGQSNGKEQIYKKRSHCNRIHNWQIFCSTLPFNLHAMLSARISTQNLTQATIVEPEVHTVTSTMVFRDGRICTHADPMSTCRTISRTVHFYCNVYIPLGMARALADSSDSGRAKFTKTGDSLPWTPMNRCAKCDAASFILGGEMWGKM